MRSYCRFIAAGAGALLLAACQPKTTDTTAGGGDIVIGATLPLSGALQSFGSFQKWGYEHAVAEINAAGGIGIDGALRKVRLVIRDDRTDANVASANIDTLVSADRAVALLGSCTPPLVIAASLAAERNATPIVSGCAPLVSFRAAKQWTWAWDLFFDDPDLAEAPFRTLTDLNVVTNRRIAILHDNSADGAVVGGRLWPEFAAKYGYEVVARAEFPVDTTDFSASVQLARKSGADILMVAVRAGADTQHIVNADILKKLGPQGTIVNISRGSVIDQKALVAALEGNVIAGACLDVYEKEPHAPDVLTKLPNVVLTPHIGGHTIESHVAMQDCVMANLDAFFAGKPLRFPVG